MLAPGTARRTGRWHGGRFDGSSARPRCFRPRRGRRARGSALAQSRPPDWSGCAHLFPVSSSWSASSRPRAAMVLTERRTLVGPAAAHTRKPGGGENGSVGAACGACGAGLVGGSAQLRWMVALVGAGHSVNLEHRAGPMAGVGRSGQRLLCDERRGEISCPCIGGRRRPVRRRHDPGLPR